MTKRVNIAIKTHIQIVYKYTYRVQWKFSVIK